MPLLLHWNVRTCAPMKNTYTLSKMNKNRQKKNKIWSVWNERLSLTLRNGISEMVQSQWVRQNVTDTILNQTSKSKSQKVTWHQILLPMVNSSTFILPKAHQRNPFKRQDWYDFRFCFLFKRQISTWKPSFGGPNKKKVKMRDEKQYLISKMFLGVRNKSRNRTQIKKGTTVTSWPGRTHPRTYHFYLQNIFQKKSKQARFSSEKGLQYSKLIEH